MELCEYLKSQDDLLKINKSHREIKCHNYHDLLILKYNYNQLNNNSLKWKRYCRGAVIDKNNKKIVMIPPIKAKEISLDKIKQYDGIENIIFKELIDGIMINIFYDHSKKEWKMSTRSEINCKNKWNKKSFRDLFYECYPEFSFNLLDTDKTYSFIMKHKSNRIISPVEKNIVILVEVRDQESYDSLNLDDINLGCEKIQNVSYEVVKSNLENKNLFFGIKGYTFYDKNERYKIINENYQYVSSIKPNTNDLLYCYLETKKDKNLNEYLKYFPENRQQFDNYKDLLYKYTHTLYEYYCNSFIKNTIKRSDIPYEYKNIIYDLHNIYKIENKKIDWKTVIDFVNNSNMKLIRSNIKFKHS